jgi:glycosyltransferase involved in cell wall biosynthesis
MENSLIKNKYDLTFIIPCYNAQDYLAKSLDSIVDEDYQSYNIQIIIVNDGSVDKSEEIIDLYCSRYINIRKINRKNGGCSEAINTGLMYVEGTFIHILAADDWIDLKVVLVSLKQAINKELDIISFGLEFINENLGSQGFLNNWPSGEKMVFSGREALIKQYVPSSICVFLMHKKLFDNNENRFISGISHNDVELSVRLMLTANRIMFTNKVGYFYKKNIGSISQPVEEKKIEKYLFDEITVSNLIKENIIKFKILDKKTIGAIQKNYNSVVWNLIWRFIVKPKEVSYQFKIKCITELSQNYLYPIKGG